MSIREVPCFMPDGKTVFLIGFGTTGLILAEGPDATSIYKIIRKKYDTYAWNFETDCQAMLKRLKTRCPFIVYAEKVWLTEDRINPEFWVEQFRFVTNRNRYENMVADSASRMLFIIKYPRMQFTLQSILDTITPAQYFTAVYEVAEALCFMVENGWSHTDTHFGNIMFDKKWHLIDFGDALPHSTAKSRATNNGFKYTEISAFQFVNWLLPYKNGIEVPSMEDPNQKKYMEEVNKLTGGEPYSKWAIATLFECIYLYENAAPEKLTGEVAKKQRVLYDPKIYRELLAVWNDIFKIRDILKKQMMVLGKAYPS